MKSTKILTPITGIALLGAAIAIASWPGETDDPSARPTSSHVRVEEVVRVAQKRIIRFSGVARASSRARLTFALPGRVAARPVKVGESVRSGDVVATLDGREYRHAEAAAASALAELEVRLAQAERDRARVERLAKARAATAEEVERVAAATDALHAAVEAATVRLSEARRLMDETTLTAPFAGTVTAVFLQPDEWAGPGIPVAMISGGSDLEVKIEVPETVVTRLPLDQAVRVELPFAAASTTGRVRTNARAASGPGSLFPVMVDLDPHPDLVPGSAVEVLLEITQAAALALPLEAVLNPGSSTPSVFRVVDGRAEQVDVDLGQLHGDLITVASELQAGDRVVVNGHTALANGEPVKVAP